MVVYWMLCDIINYIIWTQVTFHHNISNSFCPNSVYNKMMATIIKLYFPQIITKIANTYIKSQAKHLIKPWETWTLE